MPKRDYESNKIKDLIPRMLEENRLKQGMDQITVKEAWTKIMGPGVAKYTNEVSLKNGLLLVKLRSSALREELEYGKEKILKMMQGAVQGSEINKIRLL